MARTKGAKNKPKEDFLNNKRQYDTIPDILTPNEAAIWLRTNRAEIMRRIYSGEIPNNCFFRVGRHYKLIKIRLAEIIGIKEKKFA